VLLAVGGAGVAVALAFSVVSQVAALGRTAYERTATLDPLASRLTVRTDSGTIELRPSSDGRVRVDAEVRYGLGQPES
jgi:hypothetical protein